MPFARHRSRTPPRLAARTLTSLAVVSALAGCISRNAQPGVGVDQTTVPAIDLASEGASLPESSELSSERPTPLPLDRSGWERVELYIPTDDILHFPTHRTDWHLARAARERGEYPDPLSAIEIHDRTPGERFIEGLAVEVGAITDALLLPFRIVWIEPHWEPTRARSSGYQRLPSQRWTAEVVSARALPLPVTAAPGTLETDLGSPGAGPAQEQTTDEPAESEDPETP